MNKKRLTKTITFLIVGALFFVPLIFWHDILVSFVDEGTTLEQVRWIYLTWKIGKAAFIALGIIFCLVGIYNLIMMFLEEDEAERKTF